MITIIIADDHPVFRKGLRDIIGEDANFKIAGETGDGNCVLAIVQQLKPDVLLLDLNMPGTNGLDIAAKIRDQKIPVKIIVLTMHKEEGIFNKAMDIGVSGYVLKESAVQDIIESIKAVVNDDYYISPAISQYLLKRKEKTDSRLDKNPALKDLTVSERRVLRLIAENNTSKEIADQLFVSTRTVENHRMNICNKLSLHGANALLKFAIENRSYL